MIDVKPSCLIKGFPGEVPNCMDFYKKCQKGSGNIICLTIVWSSGRIQHFPIIEKGIAPVANTSTSVLSHSLLRHDTYNFDLTAIY